PASSTCEDAASAPNPIVAENSCLATSSWQPDLPLGDQHDIEAFAAPVSVQVGQSVNLYTSTTAPFYQVRVYRMGWYRGLGGHLVYSSRSLRGVKQPAPNVDPATRMVSASNWRNPLTIAVPTSWVSGVYVVKLVSSLGRMRYTFFVVRSDASHSQILFQSSMLTDQAYNVWGGRSIYQDTGGSFDQRSYAVSFDRPYVKGEGLANFPLYELNLLRWLEKEGYNVTYTTDVDTDQRPSLLLNHRLVIAAGHDEYWSAAMRHNIVSARDAGVSLAFFGANDMYWHARLTASPLGPDRVVVCYKDAALDPAAKLDPSTATVTWRSPPLNQPEDAVLGEMFAGLVQGPASLVFANGAAPFLGGTGLHPGGALPGLVAQQSASNEVDTVIAARRPPSALTILTSSPIHVIEGEIGDNVNATAMATLYTAASGAAVFDAGTYWWGLGLDDFRFDPSAPSGSFHNADFEQFTVNLLSYLLASSRR
ncbi:MAG: N,N-dimethylformamidase beta subunit family domain-containing protein, partial [Ktedonobacterales bacterium]